MLSPSSPASFSFIAMRQGVDVGGEITHGNIAVGGSLDFSRTENPVAVVVIEKGEHHVRWQLGAAAAPVVNSEFCQPMTDCCSSPLQRLSCQPNAANAERGCPPTTSVTYYNYDLQNKHSI